MYYTHLILSEPLLGRSREERLNTSRRSYSRAIFILPAALCLASVIFLITNNRRILAACTRPSSTIEVIFSPASLFFSNAGVLKKKLHWVNMTLHVISQAKRPGKCPKPIFYTCQAYGARRSSNLMQVFVSLLQTCVEYKNEMSTPRPLHIPIEPVSRCEKFKNN